VRSSGVLNLDKRANLILPGTSNKNDVIRLLGETVLKENPNEKKWSYIETIEKKTLGKRQIIKNTMLILEFDNRGILQKKKIFNKDDFQNVKFDQSESESLGVSNSFSKRIFSSIKKRAQNRLGTISK
jgi:outer membrane protein assembly factor BamE (lipoprotein component of BamABCDE complex)|tara:strand:+ start:373 stop:756 length:384 start_codon:yes stop_codon:yes gene_type:complete